MDSDLWQKQYILKISSFLTCYCKEKIIMGIIRFCENFNFQTAKLVDIYNMLEFSKLSFARRSVVWRGAHSVMLLYVHRDLDISFLAEKMALTFNSAVRCKNRMYIPNFLLTIASFYHDLGKQVYNSMFKVVASVYVQLFVYDAHCDFKAAAHSLVG